MRSTLFFGCFLVVSVMATPPATALAAYVNETPPVPSHMWSMNLTESGISLPITEVCVRDARLAMSETPMIVRGNIVQYVGSDQYVFEDDTSSILVFIPADTWQNVEVTPGDVVELHGKLLRSPTSVKIDVDKVVKP